MFSDVTPQMRSKSAALARNACRLVLASWWWLGWCSRLRIDPAPTQAEHKLVYVDRSLL
jgi:hypothetical protein